MSWMQVAGRGEASSVREDAEMARKEKTAGDGERI